MNRAGRHEGRVGSASTFATEMKTFATASAILLGVVSGVEGATITYLPILETRVIPSREPGGEPTVLPSRAEDYLDIDVNGDGVPEITKFITLESSAAVSFQYSTLEDADGLLDVFPYQEPWRVWGTTAADVFDSIPDLLGDQFYTLSLELPLYTGRHSRQAGSTMSLGEAHPIIARWMFGTTATIGEGTRPVSLIGVVVDYTDFFVSGGTEPVLIHTHDYGEFSPGQQLPTFNLGATGIPEPSVLMLTLVGGACAVSQRNRRTRRGWTTRYPAASRRLIRD